MADLSKLVRDNIQRLIPYSCARDEYKGSSGIFLDANENPFGTLNRYPDPYQRELKKAVAEFRNMPEDTIFLGNGSDEIIDLIFRIFCNPGLDKALIFPPTYGMYEVAASINDVKTLKVPLKPDFQVDIEKAAPLLSDSKLKLVFICSPNNPTGNAMNREDVRFILENFNGIVVIDEAYIDFSGTGSFNSLITEYNNLLVMQTFSKALGLAAARVGIVFAVPAVIKLLNKVKPPYNISTINQKAALGKLRKIDSYKAQLRKIKDERERVVNELLKMRPVEKIYPSDANFILVKVADAAAMYSYLAGKNIIVRNRSSVAKNCIRITIGTKKENAELIKAMKSYR